MSAAALAAVSAAWGTVAPLAAVFAAFGTGYIVAAWSVVLGVFAVYAASLIVRGRRLSRLVPPERRRWLTTPDPVPAPGGSADAAGGTTTEGSPS